VCFCVKWIQQQKPQVREGRVFSSADELQTRETTIIPDINKKKKRCSFFVQRNTYGVVDDEEEEEEEEEDDDDA
jgi:hypothetical protein